MALNTKRVYLNSVPDYYEGIPKLCFEIEHKKYIYIKTEKSESVVQGKCPHASADLCKGDIIGTRIICPLHGYKFDVTNGKNISGEGYRITTYTIESDKKGKFFVLH